MMEATGLAKTFKDVNAVAGIDFYIEEGEILGFLGPNGAGKSTTINMITSLLKPTSGEILLRGEDIKANPQKLRTLLGVVPQDIALYPELTGFENLAFFGKVHGLKGVELKEKIKAVAEIIGLHEKLKSKVGTYSGGMKRRLNIGAALLHNPKLLVMDEPTVGIDPQSRNHILETVKRLNRQGMTILYTSHYMEEVEFLCDRIYIMDKGRMIAAGTKEQLKDEVSGSDIVELAIEEDNVKFINTLREMQEMKSVQKKAEGLYELAGDKNSGLLRLILSAAEKTGADLISVQVKKPTLEDVFLYMTGRALRD
ncbi:ABC transporter ATP-binding protein [Bacillus marinisedimentorum]|uniref:ABC transporter ATP-binding protein n=1 Tax=Bacillus marinisedimentorum TaxID=1821260 RepID=UPI000872E6EB|nr:ABC transporter ATP-binding protein [Bacillus marinisedimentorum]